MKKLIPLLALILFSCSAQKRMNNLIDKYPDLVQNDTVVIQDTIWTESVKTDTVLTLESMIDTVYIEKDNLKIKTIFRDNKIYIEGECESDTIFYIKEIPIEKVVYLEDTPYTDLKKFASRWWKILIIISILLIVYMVVKRLL